jgi:hypothetical protein
VIVSPQDFPYRIKLFDESDHCIAVVESMFVPPPGAQLLVHENEVWCWEVTSLPQVHYPAHGSTAWRDGGPQEVDLRVKPGRGIHDEGPVAHV